MANKKQRDQKRRERRRLQQTARSNRTEGGGSSAWAGLTPWEPIKMRLFQAPQLLPQSVSSEDRFSLLNALGEHSEQQFQEAYFRLTEWFEQYDPLYLLAFCSVYFLSHPEGTDPEVKGTLDFYPFHLEILQAFSLTQERHLVFEPLGNESARLKEIMKDLGNAIKFREMLDWNADSDYDIHQKAFLQSVRTQTTAVRNWAYLPHMRYVTRGLAESIRQHFAELHNIDPVNLVEALFGLAYKTEERLNNHINWVRTFFHETD